MKRILFACAMSVPVLLAGCTPGTPQTPPPSTPVQTVEPPPQQFMCTPEEGGSASPCSEAEYQAQLARDKQYDEAKRVLAAYNKEFQRLAGQGASASEELLSYTGGEFEAQTRDEMGEGFRLEGGESKKVWIKRLVGESLGGSTLALETCVDGTSITIWKGKEKIGEGRISERRYFFADTDTGLKIVAAQNREVESC